MGLILFITAILLYMGRTQHLFVLETLADKEKERLTTFYQMTIASLYEKYELIGEQILMDKELIAAIKAQDRPRILALTRDIYQKLKSDNPYLEIMHFHTPDTRSLLRLHKPDIFGDDLSALRPLIKKTNETGKKQFGLEVGKYSIPHRVALPIFDQHKKKIGVLEFGINAEYVTEMLRSVYGINNLLLLNTKDVETFMDFSSDANSVKLMGKHAIFRSDEETLLEHKDLDLGQLGDSYRIIPLHDADHLVFKGADLTDFEGNSIGSIYLLKDMSFYMDRVKTIRNISIALAAVLLILAYLILHYSYHRFMRNIEVYQKRLIRKNKVLTKLSTVDHLTGAYNRRKIEDTLYNEYKVTKRYNTDLSIILLDVDNFKQINDTYGHDVGDAVLQKMAHLIKEHIREADFFGRWGGEEFLIVSPNTDLGHATILAEKLRMLIAEEIFEAVTKISCSFGVAQCEPETQVKTSIKHADDALYQAKESGKNRVFSHENAASSH